MRALPLDAPGANQPNADRGEGLLCMGCLGPPVVIAHDSECASLQYVLGQFYVFVPAVIILVVYFLFS